MSDVCLFAVLNKPPTTDGRELKALPESVKWLEVRADLATDIPREWLENHFPGRLLYTLRSSLAGGRFEGSDEQRGERIRWASKHYDLVDLEPGDLQRQRHAPIPPDQRLITWHGPAGTQAQLTAAFESVRPVQAKLYRFVLATRQAVDELTPLAMLRALGRRDVVAYGEGPTGSWSQVLAPYFGATAVFGTVEEHSAGQPGLSANQFVSDYGLPALPKIERLFGIVGGHVGRSLSPRLHNAAYRALNLPALYLPFSVPSFDNFWHSVAEGGLLAERGMRLDGFSLTAPHKEAALAAAQMGSALACRAGAANIMARTARGWQADTADADGVLGPLQARGIAVKSRPVAVLGCGGSGRSAAAALAEQGAVVTLVNRTEERGQQAAQNLNVAFLPLARFRPENFSILVNATSAGRDGEELPFAVERLGKDAVVIDFAYGRQATPVVTSVRSRGGLAIEGREVLYYQMRRQFQFMTGREMPGDLVSRLLGLNEDTSFVSTDAFKHADAPRVAEELSKEP
jgi:3-dehydroquinate dehydratase / shikimate dehydrogenase